MSKNYLVRAADGNQRDLVIKAPENLPLAVIREEIVPAVVSAAEGIAGGIRDVNRIVVELRNGMREDIEYSRGYHQERIEKVIPLIARAHVEQDARRHLDGAGLDDDIRLRARDRLDQAFNDGPGA